MPEVAGFNVAKIKQDLLYESESSMIITGNNKYRIWWYFIVLKTDKIFLIPAIYIQFKVFRRTNRSRSERNSSVGLF